MDRKLHCWCDPEEPGRLAVLPKYHPFRPPPPSRAVGIRFIVRMLPVPVSSLG